MKNKKINLFFFTLLYTKKSARKIGTSFLHSIIIVLVKKGFTLVELLVVVAILGVLAAVGIVSFGGYLGSAKENAVKTNHANMVKFTKSQLLKCTLGDTAMDLVDEQGNARPF